MGRFFLESIKICLKALLAIFIDNKRMIKNVHKARSNSYCYLIIIIILLKNEENK